MICFTDVFLTLYIVRSFFLIPGPGTPLLPSESRSTQWIQNVTGSPGGFQKKPHRPARRFLKKPAHSHTGVMSSWGVLRPTTCLRRVNSLPNMGDFFWPPPKKCNILFIYQGYLLQPPTHNVSGGIGSAGWGYKETVGILLVKNSVFSFALPLFLFFSFMKTSSSCGIELRKQKSCPAVVFHS